MTKKVIKFLGDTSPFSNFYKAQISIDSLTYDTVEHYYQSQKAIDEADKIKVATADSPKMAKYYGNRVKCRSDWDKRRLIVMYKALEAKFTQHPGLAKYLLNTGDAILMEVNRRDEFWGVGKNYKGKNMMGKMLMKLRDELKKNPIKEDIWTTSNG